MKITLNAEDQWMVQIAIATQHPTMPYLEVVDLSADFLDDITHSDLTFESDLSNELALYIAEREATNV